MAIIPIGILLVLMAGFAFALFDKDAEPTASVKKKWKSKSRELPENAIVVNGQWYRRVYGFDSKCCGNPMYGHYYIALNQVDGRWIDGDHSASLFPLEAFDDRKNGVHVCKEHVHYSNRGDLYCYVCGKSVDHEQSMLRMSSSFGFDPSTRNRPNSARGE